MLDIHKAREKGILNKNQKEIKDICKVCRQLEFENSLGGSYLY